MKEKIKNWIDKNISINLKNKNVFITGGNSGIGFELAKKFAYLGSNIYLLVRNLNKGNVAKEEILREYPNIKVNIIQLDLSNLESIESCVKELSKLDIDVFINNAGVFRLPTTYIYDDIEITMGTNFIGTYYLNILLLDYLRFLNHKVNVLFTTSITSRLTRIDYNDFFSTKNNNYIKRYGRSKVAINDLYFYLLDKYKNSNIILGLVHPGITYTPLISKGYKNKLFVNLARTFMRLIFHSSSKASLTDLYAINDNNSMVGPNGLFEISGYPKQTKFKRNKNYLKTIAEAENIIKKIKTPN